MDFEPDTLSKAWPW